MESTQTQALYEPHPTAMPQLREKPRQGFETRKTAWNPGPNVCNFTVTLGLRATVVENGVGETYSARYYNPNTGRFMSRDPLDRKPIDPRTHRPIDPKELHKYLYADGDPVNGIDPTGKGMFEGYLIEIGETAPGTLAMELTEISVNKIFECVAKLLLTYYADFPEEAWEICMD
jgi:RHS repeat-associated protein